MRVFTKFSVVSFFLLAAGCAQYDALIPEGYVGDTITLDDSFQRLGLSRGNIFYVEKVDGKEVDNGSSRTRAISGGANINLQGMSRKLPSYAMKLFLVGKVQSASPMVYALHTGSNFHIEGVVDFKPEPNKKYVVKGALEKEKSSVWIEDAYGNIVVRIDKDNSSEDKSVTTTQENKSDYQSRDQIFKNLTTGESAGLVVSKLGKPDNVIVSKTSISRPLRNTTYVYDGFGAVRFSMSYSELEYVENIVLDIRLVNSLSEISKNLTSGGMELRKLSKDYYKTIISDERVLDLFAQKIWEDRNSKDPNTIDGLVWLCRSLVKTENARYVSLLSSVVDDTTSRKLKNHARKNLKKLPETEIEQFFPITD